MSNEEKIAAYRPGDSIDIGVETGSCHSAVAVFIEEDTRLSYRMYPADQRLTFAIGTAEDVILFLHGSQLDRLIIALAAARTDLLTEACKVLGPDHPINLYPTD